MKKVRHLLLLPLLCCLGITNQMMAQCLSSTIQTTDGSTTVYTCPDDGNDDLVNLENTTDGSTNFAYVATDASNNILGINPTSTFNFEGAGIGNCLVWGFSYTGDITAEVGDFLFSTPFSSGCFQISDNLIRIIRDTPEGGTIQNIGGSNTLSFCTTDPYADVVAYNHTSSSNSAYVYVITDADNNILGNTTEQSFDFSGVPAGTCRIWGLSYSGNLSLTMGNNAATTDLSDACFDLSDNFIEVTRIDVDGGTVANENGIANLQVCAGDAVPDLITFTHENNSTAEYRYIITDEENKVLGLPMGNMQNFNGAGAGTCRVWGISFTGNLTIFGGDDILNKTLSDGCFALSENYMQIVRTGVDGGEVATLSGETTVYTCPEDGVDDVIEFMHDNNSTANFTYVVTDIDGNILGLPAGNSQNFEGAGEGTCLVWGLSYTGELSVGVGDNALVTNLSNGCSALSSNFISVVRAATNGGTVSTASGATTVYTCPGNDIADVIEFAHENNSAAQFTYVITDSDNNILGIPPGNSQNFDGAGTGVCRVWGLSYTGNILVGAGDNAATSTLTDGCFDLSENFVEVVREQPSAGTLSANGASRVYTCPGDGNDDVIEFTATDFNQNFQLVITDSDYNILGLPPENSQNFEGAGLGNCLAFGVSYTGNILAVAGDNILTTRFAGDCWDISSPVTVVRDTPNGGSVMEMDGNSELTFCTTDGNPDVINYSNNSSSNSAYTYLITDGDNNVLGINPNSSFDFEGVPAGVCRIWGLSYSGDLLAMMGDNAATATLSAGCFELSDNFITVTRTDVDGGTVAMPSGATTRYTCTQDGNADVVMFTHVSNSPAAYRYIVTDSDNNVLGLPPGDTQDFDGAPAGTCRVWGISYTGDLTLFAGDNIMNKSLSTDCYDLSENWISIVRDTPEGGTVQTVDGETSVSVTVGDGIDDILEFESAGTSNSNFTYVVTDADNNILGIPPSNSQNFEGAGTGVCRVWGLSYTGNILVAAGDNAATAELTDDCFSLSSNFIEVTRAEPFNGSGSNNFLTSQQTQTVNIQIAPNPATDFLNVRVGNNLLENSAAQISIINVQGQVVYSREYIVGEIAGQTLQLDIDRLEVGIYFLNLRTDGENLTERFVKR